MINMMDIESNSVNSEKKVSIASLFQTMMTFRWFVKKRWQNWLDGTAEITIVI